MAPSIRTDIPEGRRVLAWQHDVADSMTREAPRLAVQATPVEQAPPRIIINQVVNTPGVVVTRVRTEEQKPSDEISTRAIVGTILGATAGAVVAYAMSKGDSESHQQPQTQSKITYRTIEAPPAQDVVRVETITRNSDHGSYANHSSLANSRPTSRGLPIESVPRTYVETLVDPSKTSRRPYHTVVRREDAGPVVQTNGGTRISVGEPQGPRASHASSNRTIQRAEMMPLPPSVATQARLARDVPLPSSQATSLASKVKEDSRLDVKSSIHPHESVSQVSTRRSGKSKHHHGGSRSGSEKGHGHKSEKGSKAGSKRDTSSKISGTRSPGVKGVLGL
ncbi:hypothetical protein OEA41_006720 [Lepraria neglecta]|uniref:Uncharacterized protein n=1 Tax=Lepraria neglecta TaxID=209136 RepID=A0AAD9Z9E0_9LECA|nr:hypothetical protein OEA41_006720 [Lepraria neglecta]